MAVNEWIRHAMDIAVQVTSRTRIRQELEKYNKGKISLAQLKAFTEPKLSDAMNISKEIVGITRLDNSGKPVAHCGEIITSLPSGSDYTGYFDTFLSTPIVQNGYHMVIVSAPILNRSKTYVGADLVLINLYQLKNIIANKASSAKVSKTVLGYRYDGAVYGVFTEIKKIKSDMVKDFLMRSFTGQAGIDDSSPEFVAAYQHLDIKNWGLVDLKNKTELYKTLNEKLIYWVLTGFFIYILFLLGFWFLMKPMAGKLLLHADELENKIEEKTYELKKEIEKRKKASVELEKNIGQRKQIESDLKIALEDAHFVRRKESALLEASQKILFCSTFEEAARNIFDKCTKLIGAKSGYVALLAENGQENEVLFLESGGLPCDVDPSLPMPIRGLREVAYLNNDVAYDNHFADSQWADYMPEGHVHLKNVLFAPIAINNRTIGLIGMANKVEDFTENDAKIARSFGELAAVALTYVRIQDNLNKSEEKYRLAFLTSPDAINLNRLEDGMYIEINEGFTKIMGYSRQDTIGKSSVDLNIWNNKTDRERLVEGLQTNGIVENLEAEFISKSGDIKTGLMSARVLNIENENIILSITRDITDKKEIEKKLIKSEEQYREYFEENPAGSYISTPDGQLIACNREYLKIFGFTSKQDAFQTPISLLFEDPNERMTFVNEISRDLYLVNKETTLKRVDGSSVTVVENASGLFDKDGKLKHIRGFLLDISKQKRLEVQIQQTQKMESIGTLAGGIAHDFNNILFPIIGYSELLIGEIPKEQTSFHKSLEQIYKSAMRAKELVQQILTFSRQEKTEYSPLKIHIIVKEVLKLLRSTIPKDIEIKQLIDPSCRPIYANPTQIHQVVMNLATNAYHAMEAGGGELTIELKEVNVERQSGPQSFDPSQIPAGFYTQLKVSDTGCGISPELIEKIFDPYFTTKEKGKGTGIGLSVVHGIVEKMNGHITIASKLGEGTIIKVYFPIDKAFETQDTKSSISDSIQKGTESILLVDDEKAIVRLEEQALQKLGYQVESRTSPIEALAAFRAKPNAFDLILTDLSMPKMNGAVFAAEIQNIRADIPIILLTGFSDKLTLEEMKASGIKELVMKPVVMKDLSNKIRQVIDAH